MTCNCWRIIGEHLRCADHGGGDMWSDAAYRQTPKLDAPPLPIDINDPWFNFLNQGEKILEEVTP